MVIVGIYFWFIYLWICWFCMFVFGFTSFDFVLILFSFLFCPWFIYDLVFLFDFYGLCRLSLALGCNFSLFCSMYLCIFVLYFFFYFLLFPSYAPFFSNFYRRVVNQINKYNELYTYKVNYFLFVIFPAMGGIQPATLHSLIFGSSTGCQRC